MLAPSAENDPRLHGGRKGAYGVAARWRKRHPCPHRSDEQCGQDEGDRGKNGPEREKAPAAALMPSRSPGVPSVSTARPSRGQIRARAMTHARATGGQLEGEGARDTFGTRNPHSRP